MTVSSIAHRLALATAICAALMGDSLLHAQDAGLPEPLRAGLARYAELDPLAVTWFEDFALGQEKTAPQILGEITSRNKTIQLAFRDGRIYERSDSVEGKPAKPARIDETAFDRKVLYGGNPGNPPQQNPKRKPTLVKWLPEKDRPNANYFSDGYFRSAGIHLPKNVRELVLSWRPQSELLALLAEGERIEATGFAELNGRRLMRVQVTAQDLSKRVTPEDVAEEEKRLRLKQSRGLVSEEEVQKGLEKARKAQAARPPQRRLDFYFDPELGYAVRRLDTRDEVGRLLTRSDCTEHERLAGRNVWLPRSCRVEEYTFRGLPGQIFASPLFVEQYRVTALDLKPWPDERFELNYTTPGTRVNDRTFPEVEGISGIEYEMPANPQQLVVQRGFPNP